MNEGEIFMTELSRLFKVKSLVQKKKGGGNFCAEVKLLTQISDTS